MGKTSIGWTDQVWNPVTGCSRVSPGCEHCYAETLSLRRGWSKKPWTAGNAPENVILHPDRLDRPLHWRKPRMVFVNSMSDWAHPLVPFEFLDRMFGVVALTQQHTYQALTKRPGRALEYFTEAVGLETREEEVSRVAAHTGDIVWDARGSDYWRYRSSSAADVANRRPWPGWPLPNVWLGVSVEDQRRADERLAILCDIPAAVRWVSLEPLLGPIDFLQAGSLGPEIGDPFSFSAFTGTEHTDPSVAGIDWVVVGGETGHGHRPMKIEWVESIVEQCQAAGVPIFIKQDSGRLPGFQGRLPDELWALKQFPESHRRLR